MRRSNTFCTEYLDLIHGKKQRMLSAQSSKHLHILSASHILSCEEKKYLHRIYLTFDEIDLKPSEGKVSHADPSCEVP